jgi:transcriptional regulator with XRE-family HTH domain
MERHDGRKAKNLMKEAGITPKMYAEKFGVSEGTVYNQWKQQYLDGEFLHNLCSEINISEADFFSDGKTAGIHPTLRPIVDDLNAIMELPVHEREQYLESIAVLVSGIRRRLER